MPGTGHLPVTGSGTEDGRAGGGVVDVGSVSNGSRVSVQEEEATLETNGSDGCRTV